MSEYSWSTPPVHLSLDLVWSILPLEHELGPGTDDEPTLEPAQLQDLDAAWEWVGDDEGDVWTPEDPPEYPFTSPVLVDLLRRLQGRFEMNGRTMQRVDLLEDKQSAHDRAGAYQCAISDLLSLADQHLFSVNEIRRQAGLP